MFDDNILGLNEEKERAPCLGERKDIGFKMFTAQRRIILDVLMVCWGIGTWLGVNGLYVQLPLLVDRLPERWTLPVSMVLAVQLANIGLVIYAVLHFLFPRVSDAIYIYGLLTIGTLALFLNAFLYTFTLEIRGKEISFAFLTLTFFAALVGCSSSVLFYPYLRHFRDVYLVTFLVGEGLSGFIPSILALIQGAEGEPECLWSADNSTVQVIFPPARFDSKVFFIIMSGLSLLSLVSFTFVDRSNAFQSERVAPKVIDKHEEATTQPFNLLGGRWITVLILMAVLNALTNGVLPSIQSYSCKPYGTMAYHLAVTLSTMVNPAACMAGVWLKPMAPRLLGIMLTAALIPIAYILATALLSPTPPLQYEAGGVALVVIVWVLVSASMSYSRMWIYGWARNGGARGMRACGTATQAGSALGSLLLYYLISIAQIFQTPVYCPSTSRHIL